VLNVCLICSPLLIVKVIFVITVVFLFLLCVSTILVNKDDQMIIMWATLINTCTDVHAHTGYI